MVQNGEEEDAAVEAVKPDEVAGTNSSVLLCDDCEREFTKSAWQIVDADRIDGEIFREIWKRDDENIMHIYGCEHAGYYNE